jgi:sugar lactone lactonase YvrE
MRPYFIMLIVSALLLVSLPCGAEQAIVFQPVVSVYADRDGLGLLHPEGVACTDSDLLVADTGNGRLLRFTVQAETVEFASQIKVAQLASPIRVQTNSKGEIFALDGKNRRIVRLTGDGGFAGTLDMKDVPAGAGAMIVPRSFKIDARDNIYVADILAGRVIVLNPQGGFMRQIPFPAGPGFFSDLAVGADGTVFLLDSVNAMVYAAAPNAAAFSPLTKNLQEYMSFPTCITTGGSRGVLYITDQNGGHIVLVGLDGSFRGRKAGFGWNEGLLNYPAALCINGAGYAFVADRDNNRVQIFR